jgi:transposase
MYTIFSDLDTGVPFYFVKGMKQDVVGQMLRDCIERGLDPSAVTDFAMDMSPAFRSGVRYTFPNLGLPLTNFTFFNFSGKEWMSLYVRSRRG